jgi:DNA mismatch repair protein MutS2
LRGKRAEMALSELGAFLDKALLSNMEGAEIVHGRGTGALRREVHNFLRSFPGIAAFALAPEDQGGDGMTMVTFR